MADEQKDTTGLPLSQLIEDFSEGDTKPGNDRACTIRIPHELHARVAAMAKNNKQTVSSMIAGFVESSIKIIRAKPGAQLRLPYFISMCRNAELYNNSTAEKIDD